jgi:hypothetical protein
MTLPEGTSPVSLPGQSDTECSHNSGRPGVIGNERLTALAGGVLLVLIVVELATTASLHTLLSLHVVVGVLLTGPLAVKLGSTGYRFVRYYTAAPAYVRRGPPRLALRVLAPLLVATTLALIGSGIGLLIAGPPQDQEGLLLRVHALSTLLWIPLLAIHAVAYLPRVQRLIADDWSKPPVVRAPGRSVRLGVSLGALLGSVIAAVLLLPAATPWNAWIQTNGNHGPAAPLVAGTLLAVLALVALRPLRWR